LISRRVHPEHGRILETYLMERSEAKRWCPGRTRSLRTSKSACWRGSTRTSASASWRRCAASSMVWIRATSCDLRVAGGDPPRLAGDAVAPPSHPEHGPECVREPLSGLGETPTHPHPERRPDPRVLALEVRVAVSPRQACKIQPVRAGLGDKGVEPGERFAVEPDLLLDVVPLELVYGALDLFGGQAARGTGLADVAERRLEPLGPRGAGNLPRAPCASSRRSTRRTRLCQ
jgi:hypothetical protein